MRRSEIKVGEVYAVRIVHFDGYINTEPVPARVLDADAPVEWTVPGYTHKTGFSSGGVLVEFVEPTRIGYGGFSLAKQTNENAGKVERQYVLHNKRPGCGGNVGRCFVGVWSELQAQARADKRAEKEAKQERERRADAFAPALVDFVAKLRKIGLRTEMHSDASGLHGDVGVGLYTNGEYGSKARPVGFNTLEVSISKQVFDQLVEIAARHGEKITTAAIEEDED